MASNTEILKAALAAWNRGDLDAYLTLYDDSIKLHGYAPGPMNKAELADFYRYAIWGAFPNPQLELHDVFENGDKLVARATLTGKHEGPFMGVPATGTPVAIPTITILQFKGGKCVERWSQADMLGVMLQIGALPAPS